MLLLDTIRARIILHSILKTRTKPEIEFGVGVLYDSLYGRSGTLPSKTTNSIPSWLISNRGIRILNKLGYILCRNCGGDGWDADCGGGLFICPECEGTGIVDGRPLCTNCGHPRVSHYADGNCHHGYKDFHNSKKYNINNYPCKCTQFTLPWEIPETKGLGVKVG